MSKLDTDYSLTDDVREMAVWYWQDSLAKFFPTSKGPTGTELAMFEAGYKMAAIRGAEHHVEVTEKLAAENARMREALERIAKASMPHEEPVSRMIARDALEAK